MTRPTCRDIEALIDREAHGFSDAERLCVEQHLGTCASCRETLALARFVRETALAAPSALSSSARERALGRAFAQAGGGRTHGARTVGARGAWLWGGALVASAAAAVVLILLESKGDTHIAGQKRSESTVPAVVTPAKSLAPGSADSPSEPAWIEARVTEQRRFAHAEVTLGAATRARFDERSATLTLERGSMDVDVDVSKGRPFSVITQHFRVQVLGTRFVVTPETVLVRHGHVQVFGRDGRVLARDLGAGASFSYSSEEPREKHETRPEKKDRETALTARELLARARDVLTRGDASSAKKLILRAEESKPTRSDRAEAATLRAEAALLEHDAKSALALYETVAERFPDLPAGDNAGFAAAQLAPRVDGSRTRSLLGRYLELHPRGRFADEAKRRMKDLTGP